MQQLRFRTRLDYTSSFRCIIDSMVDILRRFEEEAKRRVYKPESGEAASQNPPFERQTTISSPEEKSYGAVIQFFIWISRGRIQSSKVATYILLALSFIFSLGALIVITRYLL